MPTPRRILAVLTDRTRLTPNWALAQACAEAITGGANLVVYLENDLKPTLRAKVAGFLAEGVKQRCAWVGFGDSEFAHANSADGVMLQSPDEIASARTLMGEEAIIGVSVSSVEQATQCTGADFVLAVLDWRNSEAALDRVMDLVESCPVPLVIGTDMSTELAARCVSLGAIGVAVCNHAMSAYDKSAALETYAKAIGLESNGWAGPAYRGAERLR